MIIEFKVSNFRSIKTEQVLSLEASSTKSKLDNTFELTLSDGSTIRLLRSAVIYGANASGKSNIIRAFHSLYRYVLESSRLKVEQEINFYQPFILDTTSSSEPVSFDLTFIGSDKIKYHYALIFNSKCVVNESLDYFPKGQKTILFKREGLNEEDLIHKVKLGKTFNYKEIDLFRNQLLLSKFGSDIPNEILTQAYMYFSTIEVWNVLVPFFNSRLTEKIVNDINMVGNDSFKKRLNRLIKVADTKLEGVLTKENPEGPEKDSGTDKLSGRSYPPRNLYGQHIVYENEKPISIFNMPFERESAGTKMLFALGGIILKKLETGGVIFFDELDNSLHPLLVKFLIKLFHVSKCNGSNAQLIFATHEVTILDKDMFRSDQIWFTEKNKFGETELYSAQDFKGIREEIPFEKWYMSGKFGGIPELKELEFIFKDEQEN